MTVLFDLTATQPNPRYKYHGGGEYCALVFLQAIARGFADTVAIYDPERELDPAISAVLHAEQIKAVPVTGLNDVQEILKQGGFTAFFSGLPYEYVDIDLGGTRFVMTIHGLRALEMPISPMPKYAASNAIGSLWQWWLERNRGSKRYKDSLRRMKRLINRENITIITDSLHSKYALTSHFPSLDLDSVAIIQPPMKDISIDEKAGNKQPGGHYILLGADRWIKNTTFACHVLDQMMSEGLLKERKVLVLGSNDPAKFQSNFENPEQFDVRGFVEREQLVGFYRGAFGLIYPSLSEGFGYPPLDAMQLGVPVLASSLSSIPEVCEGAALYFDPRSEHELRNRVLQLENERGLHEFLVAKGYSRYATLKSKEADMMDEIMNLLYGSSVHLAGG